MKIKSHSTAKNISSSTVLLEEIRALIISARRAVVRSVDTIQVLTNFEIGRKIFHFEQCGKARADYGARIIEKLSYKLTMEFGKGFSSTNLKLMRQFYIVYVNRMSQTVSDPLVSCKKSQTSSDSLRVARTSTATVTNEVSPMLLSWSHYVFLIGIADERERNFYEIESCEQKWSLRELERQFNSGLFERLALSRGKQKVRELSQKGQIVTKPQDVLKEPYVLEFLGLDEKIGYSELDMETAIINKLEHFLLELGKGFLFEARQKRFTFEEEHFFVDLVFYNRLLKAYVLIDLKIGKLTHQDLGQMQMYVNYFDRYVKTEGENPTVGIILCRKNKEALVEITLPKGANIHAKEYRVYLPSKEELKRRLMQWSNES